jgi:hypothetical protein
MGQLGEPVLLEDFNGFGFDMIIFMFRGGVEGELALGRESRFDHLHGGPFSILVDKKGLLAGTTFPRLQPAEAEQRERLRHLIYWFWRDVSVFSKAMAREHTRKLELWVSTVHEVHVSVTDTRPTDAHDNFLALAMGLRILLQTKGVAESMQDSGSHSTLFPVRRRPCLARL